MNLERQCIQFYRGNMSPMSPDSEAAPSFSCVVRLPSTSSPIDRSASPSDAEKSDQDTQQPRRDRFDSLFYVQKKSMFKSIIWSLKPIISPASGHQTASETSNSPTSSKRGLRRQANYEEQPLKSGWCSNPNLLANTKEQHQTVAKSASSDVGRWTSIQSGTL